MNKPKICLSFTPEEREIIEDVLEKHFSEVNFAGWAIFKKAKDTPYVSGSSVSLTQHIEVSSKSCEVFENEFRWVVTHELRHAEQAIKGILRVVNGNLSWTLTNYTEHALARYFQTTLDYVTAPWEKDANGFAFSCVDVGFEGVEDRTKTIYYLAKEHAEILIAR